MSVPLRRNRDFTLLWSGQAISELGTRASDIALPLLVLAVTGSPAKAGIVAFAGGIPYVLFGLPAGALADRWDRKRLMFWCDVGRACAMATLPLALAADDLTFPHIAAAAFAAGTFTTLARPAEFSALRHVVPAEQIPVAISRNEARTYAAQLAGPPVGGVLFGLGRALPFIADTVSYVVSAITLLLIRADFQEARESSAARLRHEVGEGVRWVLGQPFVRAVVIRAGVGNFVSNGLFLIVIVVATERGASSGLVGSILAVAAAGGLLGAAAAPWLQRRAPATAVIVGYHAVYAVLIPLFLFVPPAAFGALFALMLFGAPALNAVLGTYAFALVPDRLMARVDAATGVLTSGASPLSRLVAGLLLSAVGANTTILVWAGIAIALAAATAGNKAFRNLPAGDQLHAAGERA